VRRASVLGVCFVGVILGGTAAWWGFPPVALAAGTCNNFLHTAAGRTTAGAFQDLGVRASGEDHVYPGGVQCSQNDTVLVLMPDQVNYAEAGWATEQTAYHQEEPACAASGMTNSPQAFYFYRQDDNDTCVYFNGTISVSGGDNPTASVYSSAANPGTWILDFSNGSGNGFTHSVPGWSHSVGAGLTNCD